MRRQLRFPRLNIAEVRGLGRAARQLAAIAATLKATSWASAPAVLVNVEQVYEAIAPIYNKGEPFLPEFRKGRGAQDPGERLSEDSGQAVASLEGPTEPAEAEA
jgi:hypothetical protein